MGAIDADAHVIESMDTWALMAEEEPKLLPMITRRVAGRESANKDGMAMQDYWVINGRLHNRDSNVGQETTRESREMQDVTARLTHMDELGVDVQVLFPTLLLRPVADNARLDLAIARSYNRWLAGIWEKGKGRLRWAAVPPLLSLHKPDLMREELTYAKEHGACAIFMRPLECERPLTDEYFHPLYEIASDLDLAVCMHLGNGSFDIYDFYTRDTTFTKFKLAMIGCFHSLLLAGTPAKFPGVRWGIIEASADWIPFTLNDLRQRMLKSGRRMSDTMLADNNIFVTCQVEDDLPHVIGHAGPDNLVIGTDYGHSDFSSQIEALRLLEDVEGIGAETKRKILWDNARRLYALETPAVASVAAE